MQFVRGRASRPSSSRKKIITIQGTHYNNGKLSQPFDLDEDENLDVDLKEDSPPSNLGSIPQQFSVEALDETDLLKVIQTKSDEAIQPGAKLGSNKLNLLLEWELPAFCTQELEDGADIGSVLCVTGSATDAWATTCGEYLERFWPSVHLCILNSIAAFRASDYTGKHGTLQTPVYRLTDYSLPHLRRINGYRDGRRISA